MAKCEMIYTAGPYGGTVGSSQAFLWCGTHQYNLGPSYDMTPPDCCPFGRIEQRLERLEKKLDDIRR